MTIMEIFPVRQRSLRLQPGQRQCRMDMLGRIGFPQLGNLGNRHPLFSLPTTFHNGCPCGLPQLAARLTMQKFQRLDTDPGIIWSV